MIEVDQNERVILTGNEADSVAATRVIGLQAFVKDAPSLRVCAAGGFAMRLNRDFGPPISSWPVIPADELVIFLYLLWNVVRLNR
jgi:hypothetical protein